MTKKAEHAADTSPPKPEEGAASHAAPRYSSAGLFVRGMLMGAADVVPGVSGGTMALILGIYTAFIDALGSLNLRWLRPLIAARLAAPDERRLLMRTAKIHFLTIHWRFLLSLGAGMLFAIAIGSHVIPGLLATHRSATMALFFGLILGSIPLPARMVGRWGALEGAIALAAALFAFWLTGLPALQLTHALWLIFASGMIAICAMVLPGISGSFMLLVLGQYAYVVGSIPAKRYRVLAVFALGAGVGLIGFSRLLRYLLHRHTAPTLAALTGFMVGALHAVWPFQVPLGPPQNGKQLFVAIWPQRFDAEVWQALLLVVLGLVVVLALEWAAARHHRAHGRRASL